ncbi:glutathione S-transferase [Alteromonadaceae bacterium M269]|nr:glutathione S-transferase [Alteromonadaceae bacterium M269]
MKDSEQYTLYGAPFSLYTGKARAYLNYKRIPYQEVLSSLGVYKKIIIPKTGVRFIPVVKTPQDEYIQDTAVIIDKLEEVFPDRPIMPRAPKQRLVSQLFELYGDEWLLMPAMHYRWNKDNDDYVFANFGAVVAPGWPKFIQKFLGKKVGSKFKGYVPMLGMSEKTIPAIEDWYENDFLMAMDKHFSEHDYLLGGAATIGDFGLMGSLYAHLYLDPYPGEMMRRIAPNVAKWVERMNEKPETVGDLVSDDEIPQTLIPVIKRLFNEHWAFVKTTIDTIQEWAESNAGVEVPRMLGQKAFKMGDVEGEKAITTFTQWKTQRILDTYQAFEESDKASVDAFLESVGGYESLQLNIKKRMSRENNQLSFG